MEPTWLAETRESYDRAAASYADLLADALDDQPDHRALFEDLADLVGPGARVADIGCGPGHVTAHLAGLGLDAFGIDLSPGMVREALRRHPGLRFEVGDVRALDVADGELAGAVAWYSLIHLPPDVLPVAVTELRRVLFTGGQLLTAFQVGDEQRRIEQAYGHDDLGLDAWRLSPERIEELLGAAGFAVHRCVVRPAEGAQKSPQAYLMATAT